MGRSASQCDRAQFVLDFTRSFQAAAEVAQWALLTETVCEWKATAAIHADPALARQLTEPLSTDLGPVPHPAET